MSIRTKEQPEQGDDAEYQQKVFYLENKILFEPKVQGDDNKRGCKNKPVQAEKESPPENQDGEGNAGKIGS